MTTLYRKYRPQNFAEVIGQNHIKITLEHEIEANKLAHAYLFCGPRAVGKTTIARVFAKAINCLNRQEGEHEPCNKCEMCEQITSGRILDIIEVDAASHTGVDNVRENIIAASRVMPSRAKYKVFIIDEVHMLSISAFNALLKIIEEPPEFVVFILCTTEIHKVPATIISRCQRFDFKRISVVDITNKLQYIVNKEGIVVAKNILEAIARQSEGHMRDAESLLGQVVSIGGKEITAEEADLVIPRSNLSEAINLIGCLVKKDAGAGIGLINKLMDEGINLTRFLTDIIELLRKIMLAKLSPALAEKLGMALGESLEIKINEISKDMSLEQSILFIEKMINAKNEARNSFILQLPIEMAIAELCSSSMPRTFISARPAVAAVPPTANPQYKPQIDNSTVVNQTINGQGAVNKEIVSAKWNEVLTRIKKYNHSLSLILRVCQPVEINGNQLCLAFKYKFHKDRINEIQIKKIVETVLQEVYGTPLTIEAVIDENLEVNQNINVDNDINQNVPPVNSESQANDEPIKPAGEGLIDNLLKTFGGKIVN